VGSGRSEGRRESDCPAPRADLAEVQREVMSGQKREGEARCGEVLPHRAFNGIGPMQFRVADGVQHVVYCVISLVEGGKQHVFRGILPGVVGARDSGGKEFLPGVRSGFDRVGTAAECGDAGRVERQMADVERRMIHGRMGPGGKELLRNVVEHLVRITHGALECRRHDELCDWKRRTHGGRSVARIFHGVHRRAEDFPARCFRGILCCMGLPFTLPDFPTVNAADAWQYECRGVVTIPETGAGVMTDRKSASAAGRQGGTARKGAVKKTAKKRTEAAATMDVPAAAPQIAAPQVVAAADRSPVAEPAAAPAAPAAAPKAAGAGELVEVKQVDADVLDRIRRHAYQIWRERGGDPMENWLEAERRVAASR